MKTTTVPLYDILGISSAIVCLVHCIVMPVLSIVPFGFLQNAFIDFIFATIGIYVVSKVLMSSATKKIKYILGFSSALIIINVLAELLFNCHLHVILIGGLGMIVGHYLNYKSHR